MEQEKSTKIRKSICIAVTVVIFLGFVVRLFDWQLVNGEQYRQEAENSIQYTVKSEATRGEIYDVNGEPLAVNETGYNVVINKLYLKNTKVNDVILKLFEVLQHRGEKWIDELPITIDKNGEYSFVEDKDSMIEGLRSRDMLDLSVYSQPEEYIQKLTERYDAEEVKDKTLQRNLVSVRYNMERMGFKSTTPYVFAEDISEDMVLILSEQTQGINGVEVQTTTIRTNKNPTVAPHIVGAMGSITEKEYEEKTAEEKKYSLNDKIGKFGIESSLEDELKGEAGTKVIQKNAEGTILNVVDSQPAQPGNSVFLTLNSKYQLVANKALEDNIKAAKAAGEQEAANAKASNAKTQSGFGEDCETGAVVMLRVKDFAVLSAASYPGYDLEQYSKYGEYYQELEADANSPMYNRAFVGSFAPGSIYKPSIAIAALEEKAIDESTVINCTKIYDYYPTGVVSCMGYHGPITLHTAISHSCNYYFAEVGRLLGIDTQYLYAEKFGLGVKTGLEVSESQGILAGRDSKDWYEGNTVQASIGQSDNAFTPVQLATYTATVANNGVRCRTHVVDKITNYAQDQIIKENKADSPEVVEEISISPYNMKLVQESMREVVTDAGGTANYMFGNYGVAVAGKTGTAEIAGGSDHTTFICYAPYEDPEVAVAVVLEHGASGQYSMNVAKAMLDAYFYDKTVEDMEKEDKAAKSE